MGEGLMASYSIQLLLSLSSAFSESSSVNMNDHDINSQPRNTESLKKVVMVNR